MKSIFLAALLMSITPLGVGQMKIEFSLNRTTALPCETIEFRVAWQNVSGTDLRIGPPIHPTKSRALGYSFDGRLQSVFNGTAPRWSEDAPSMLKPGEKVEDSGYWSGTALQPGKHLIKMVADFRSFPEGYFHGVVESNTIEFTLESPQGEDLKAWKYIVFKEFGSDKELTPDQRSRVCGPLLSSVVTQTFPTSTYAAWVYLEQFQSWNPTVADPSTFLEFLQKPDYPPRQVASGQDGKPISDGKGGYQLLDGKEWAQNLVNQGEPIVKVHGDDPYLGPRLRIDVAMACIAVGKYEAARGHLDELVKNTPSSDLAAKAKEYLALMKKAGLTP